jgi:hypothetical protein
MRIRTLDRTVVSVPNGQIAGVTLENLYLAALNGLVRADYPRRGL